MNNSNQWKAQWRATRKANAHLSWQDTYKQYKKWKRPRERDRHTDRQTDTDIPGIPDLLQLQHHWIQEKQVYKVVFLDRHKHLMPRYRRPDHPTVRSDQTMHTSEAVINPSSFTLHIYNLILSKFCHEGSSWPYRQSCTDHTGQTCNSCCALTLKFTWNPNSFYTECLDKVNY